MPPSRNVFRSLIVGEDQYILSHSQYKRILLTGQLCLITVALCIVYLFIDLFNGRPFALPYQAGCAALALASFLLNRFRYFNTARFLLGFTVNITVFLFAVSEPVHLGLYMYFITASLGALISFGYEERYTAIAFVMLSTVLFVITLYAHFSILPDVTYTEEYIRLNILVNFIGSGWASVCILFFLMSINHRWEKALTKNEAEIRQKNIELTNLNNSLDRFVYSTSHDLRSPLRSIRGLIQLTQLSSELPEIRQYVGEMTKRIEYLEKFISNIADYSRNRAQEIVTQDIHVKRFLLESLESLRYFPGASELLVNLEVEDDLVVTLDSTRLQVILSNLISNAIKYRDTGKEKSFLIIRAEHLNEALIVTVEDNGIGIPETYLNRIFDMYVRAHEQSQGSGLGLFILKEAVEKMSGTIEVNSREKEGTSFIVRIPSPRSHLSNLETLESLPAS